MIYGGMGLVGREGMTDLDKLSKQYKKLDCDTTCDKCVNLSQQMSNAANITGEN